MFVRPLLLALAVLALPASTAHAALTAKVSVQTKSGASRLVVVLGSTGAVAKRARPKAVTLVAQGRSYKLTRAGASAAAVRLGTWRSKAFTGADAQRIQGLAGGAVKVKVRSAAGTKTVGTTVAGTPGGGTPGGGTPAGNGPTSPGPGTGQTAPAQVFPSPSAPSTGNQAFEEIKGYFADSRFTDCPTGWGPGCPVEERYSHFANGDQWYCRLTPTSGSDIRSYGQIAQISGAEHNADGSWGVEYYLSSYGNTVFYSWTVSNMGQTTGRYWGPGQSPATGPPSQQLTGLQWVRGALDCSY